MQKRTYQDAVLILEGLRPNMSVCRPFHDASSPHLVNITRFLHRCGLSLNDLDRLSVIHVSGSKGKDAVSLLEERRPDSSENRVRALHDATSTRQLKMTKFLLRTGLSLEDLDRLSVIHVSGTKGKGSTCALTESILRNLGVRTGLLIKPHITSYTERIRLNGVPIPETTFTELFWKTYDKLNAQKENDKDMPNYSIFINIMAFTLFLEEDVDVVIVEVGCGGEYDSTNVLRGPKTVGIGSLGLDHMILLGNSLEAIAWQKSGIMKPGSSAFSNPQYDECIPVLLSRAQERETTLQFVPKFSDYKYHDENVLSQIKSNPTKVLNSSLAIQLSYDWIRKNSNKISNESILKQITDDCLTLPREVAEGLMNCYWRGRFETVKQNGFTFYIDSAHTMESLQICADWFNSKTKLSNLKKLLIFNITNGRDYCRMLDLINKSVDSFDEAFFVPNISSFSSHPLDNKFCLNQANLTQDCAKYWSELSNQHKSKYFGCISDILDHLHRERGNSEINILVTGSCNLVSAVLNTLKTKIPS